MRSSRKGWISEENRHKSKIMYSFGYTKEFFSFQNNSKNQDPSFKMDLDLWDCSGRIKLVL